MIMKKILLTAFVATFGLSYGQTPVASYNFTGNANDGVGTNHGIVSGATLIADRNANTQSAYSFNGISDYIEIPNNSILKPSFPISVSSWVKYNSFDPTYTEAIFSSNPNLLGYSGYSVGTGPGGIVYAALGDGTGFGSPDRRTAVTTSTLSLNTWHHVVGVFHSLNNIEIYIDGQLQSTTITGTGTSMNYSADNARIGGHDHLSNIFLYMDATIDDIAIYNVALTGTQVQTLYGSTPPTPVYGCTNPASSNYNPLATVDDGSCTTTPPPTAGDPTIDGWIDNNGNVVLANGNVGIGTTNPTSNIHIKEASTNAVKMKMKNSNSQNGGFLVGLASGNQNGNNAYLNLKENKNLLFKTNNTEAMRITKTGDVSMKQDLTVEGLIESTTNGFKFPDGTMQTTAAAAGLGSQATPFNELYVKDFIKLGNNSLYLTGSTTPLLTLPGGCNTQAQYELFATDGDIHIQSNNSTGCLDPSTTHNTILNQYAGNVGIGTGNPINAKLHVNSAHNINGISSERDGNLVYQFATPIPNSIEAVAVSTFGSNVTKKLDFRVDKVGRTVVGENLQTDDDKFQVDGTTFLGGKTRVNSQRPIIFGLNGGSAIYGSHIGFNTDLNTSASQAVLEKLGNTNQQGGAVQVVDHYGNMSFQMYNGNGSVSASSIDYNPQVTFANTGNVGIGTSTPSAKLAVMQSSNTEYALYVENNGGNGKGILIKGGAGCGAAAEHSLLRVTSYSGSCERDLFLVDGKTGQTRAREILVDAAVWADYVFADDFKLKDLEEVEAFIEKNNHLPDVPSATEIKKDGINLGEMDALLLQKIEELTLYTIKQQKLIDVMKTQLEVILKK